MLMDIGEIRLNYVEWGTVRTRRCSFTEISRAACGSTSSDRSLRRISGSSLSTGAAAATRTSPCPIIPTHRVGEEVSIARRGHPEEAVAAFAAFMKASG
jgi:hypothetical protein